MKFKLDHDTVSCRAGVADSCRQLQTVADSAAWLDPLRHRDLTVQCLRLYQTQMATCWLHDDHDVKICQILLKDAAKGPKPLALRITVSFCDLAQVLSTPMTCDIL